MTDDILAQPVVYTIPNMDQVVRQHDLAYKTVAGEASLLDVYSPPDRPAGDLLSGVIFIHGGPIPAERNMKAMGQYTSWGALAAASGMIGVTFNHRYHGPELLEESTADVLAAIDFVRQQAARFNLDPDRLCLWTCSGGGPHICFALRDQPAYVRCLVMFYPILDIRPVEFLASVVGEETARQYSAVVHAEDNPIRFPIFLARAGQEDPIVNQMVDSFVAHALLSNDNLELVNHPQGQHGFDILNNDSRSRQIIARTLAFIRENV